MTVTIGGCLSPSYFVSYSRKQEPIARTLRKVISSGARSVWFDRDSILAGDAWPDEIRTGIGAADELVLILSDDSLASEAVAREVDLAVSEGKLIRPIAVTPLSRDLPVHLSRIHYLDVSAATDNSEALRRLLEEYFGRPDGDDRPDVKVKLFACRAIWPRFSEALISGEGQIEAQKYAACLARLRTAYSDSSAIQLNAGLMLCVAGRWEEGVGYLRRYAHAAHNFAGWMFLAMHLLHRESVRNVPLARVKEALDAIRAALQFGQNPLALLTATILETGGENLGHLHLDRRMREFAVAQTMSADPASEYVRAFWCLRPSFSCLFGYQQSIQTLIREIARDRHAKA